MNLEKQARPKVFLNHVRDEILDDNNRVRGFNSSKATIHNSDREDTKDNHEIMGVVSEKADSHYKLHVNSITLTKIQEKVNDLFKFFSDKFPGTAHKLKEKPKVSKCCYRCGQSNHFKRNCPSSKQKELSQSLEIII